MEIKTINDALEFLRTYKDNLITILNEQIVISIDPTQWLNIASIENDIQNWMYVTFNHNMDVSDDSQYSTLHVSLECYVLNQLHDNIMPIIYAEFKEEDYTIFHRCNKLQSKNITPEQLGASKNYNIPLAASIVELASLDTHKTVLGKINCLTACYDFIYAELKLAMVEIIAESGSEHDIPVINIPEVIPILEYVIIKSKLMHLYSNLYFIENFTGILTDDINVRGVLQHFQTAIQHIIDISENLQECDNPYSGLDIYKFSSLMLELNSKPIDRSLCGNAMKNVTRLISQSHEDIHK